MKKRILVVDDEPKNITLLKDILERAEYQVLVATNGLSALQIVERNRPDLILLDIMMPKMDGYETCSRLHNNPDTAVIPIIFVTAMTATEEESRGFEVGAVDYITKPVSAPTVLARVKTHLSLVSINELEASRLKVIQRLGRAAEYKDNETGLHVIRMSHYSHLLALAAGMSEEEAKLLLHAAPMHDVGKIGVPDHILLKPGKLDEEEWKIMRRHPSIGASIIGNDNSPLLEMARTCALSHHEKCDGNGYPQGLSGEGIPLVARIVAIADVFDALTTVRPYKEAWPVKRAVTLLREEAGSHFDPELIELFRQEQTFRQVLAIRERWSEKRAPIENR